MLTCPYCKAKAEFVDSAEIYGRSYGMIYLCRPCDAYVGVHKGTEKPLGRLANAELREWKIKAHAAFDPLWKRKMIRDNCRKQVARGKGYKWLAGQLEINCSDCHIGMFDVKMCKKVIDICGKYNKKKA